MASVPRKFEAFYSKEPHMVSVTKESEAFRKNSYLASVTREFEAFKVTYLHGYVA